MENNLDRIRDQRLKDRVVTPEEAWIQSGMTLGLSGFTRAGDVKAVPFALVNRVKNDESFKVNVYTGASLGSDVDKLFAEAGILGKRLPFQADATMRKGINNGDFLFVDQHLSHTAELPVLTFGYRFRYFGSGCDYRGRNDYSNHFNGNSLAFSLNAKSIIIEMNMAQSAQLEGLHDLYEPGKQGEASNSACENR